MINSAQIVSLVFALSGLAVSATTSAAPEYYAVSAEYVVHRNLSKEKLDQLGRPWGEFRTQTNSMVRFDIDGGRFRGFEKTRRSSDAQASEALQAMAVTPEAKKLLEQYNRSDSITTIEKVDIQDVDQQTGLHTQKKKTSRENRGDSFVNKQAYRKLVPVPTECGMGQYSFRNTRLNQLMGCKLHERIAKQRIVKTGQSDAVTVQFRAANGDLIKKSELQCDYYQPKPNNVEGKVSSRSWCIADIEGTTVALIFTSYQELPGKPDGTYKLYRLMELDLAPELADAVFDFKRAELCEQPDPSASRTVCRKRG